MDLHDLVPDMDAVLEWEEQVAQMCPVISGRNGEKPTDIVAACPMNPDQLGFGLLLESLALSAEMRRPQNTKELNTSSVSGSEHLQRARTTKEDLFWPLLSPEFVPSNHICSPLWCGSPKSHFGGLLHEIYNSQRDAVGHAVIPLLIPTFSAPSHVLHVEAVPTVPDHLKIFSEIHMSKIVRQFSLRDSMKEHLNKIENQVSRADGPVLSVLHFHVHMKEDHAQDIVDYLRFQIEWFAKELADGLNSGPVAGGVHVLALVVHGVRGCEQDRSMRPFLLAGPCLQECHPGDVVKTFPWTGVAVDHFSHLLPWGMRPEELFDGTINDIFGLEEAHPERFCLILADALPHVVPRFGHDHPYADCFTIVQTLMQQIRCKPELVKCIRAVLTQQLEQARFLSVADLCLHIPVVIHKYKLRGGLMGLKRLQCLFCCGLMLIALDSRDTRSHGRQTGAWRWPRTFSSCAELVRTNLLCCRTSGETRRFCR